MAVLKILKFPNPILLRRSRVVEIVRPEDRELLDSMLETMRFNQGIGLAAPQVGISKRIIVIDIGRGPIELINPVINKRAGSEKWEEGCLSLSGITLKIKRAKRIGYKGLDREGRLVEAEAEGLLARAIQHEIDHLDGRLLIYYANPIKRIYLKRILLKSSCL